MMELFFICISFNYDVNRHLNQVFCVWQHTDETLRLLQMVLKMIFLAVLLLEKLCTLKLTRFEKSKSLFLHLVALLYIMLHSDPSSNICFHFGQDPSITN